MSLSAPILPFLINESELLSSVSSSCRKTPLVAKRFTRWRSLSVQQLTCFKELSNFHFFVLNSSKDPTFWLKTRPDRETFCPFIELLPRIQLGVIISCAVKHKRPWKCDLAITFVCELNFLWRNDHKTNASSTCLRSSFIVTFFNSSFNCCLWRVGEVGGSS